MTEGQFIVPWEEFSKPEIFEHVRNVRDFDMQVQYPRFLREDDSKPRERFADRLYEELYYVVRDAKLARFEQVKRFTTSDALGAEYDDSDYQFTVGVDRDLTLRLRRPGSSFERFYRWYETFMPHFGRLVQSVTLEYQQIVNTREGTEIVVAPSRALYRYRFLLHNFRSVKRRASVKNTRLLSAALQRVPGRDGKLVTLEDALLPEMGRVDISISRWNQSPSGMIREIYSLEAPANRDYGALWADFTYVGETGPTELPPRTIVDFDVFFERIDIPLNDFLHTRCLQNFIGTLTDNITFDTTAGELP